MGVYPGNCVPNPYVKTRPKLISKKEVIVKDLTAKKGIQQMEKVEKTGSSVDTKVLIIGGLVVIVFILLVK